MRNGRLRRYAATLLPAALAGGFLVLTLASADKPSANPLHWVLLLVVGGLLGVCVCALIRLFRIAPWGYPLAGLFAGPVPASLLMNAGSSADERGGLVLLGAVFGVLIGLLEWARVRGPAASADPVPPEPDEAA